MAASPWPAVDETYTYHPSVRLPADSSTMDLKRTPWKGELERVQLETVLEISFQTQITEVERSSCVRHTHRISE